MSDLHRHGHIEHAHEVGSIEHYHLGGVKPGQVSHDRVEELNEWGARQMPGFPYHHLCRAIELMGAFMMGANDAQVHMANEMRKAQVVRASLPPDWRVP
jgi:hypothetical protein